MTVHTPMSKHASLTADLLIARQDIYLGVDIGGTNTKFGFVDDSGKSFEVSSFATGAELPFENFMERFAQSVSEKLKDLPDKYVLSGIGIGAPNANYLTGCIEEASNLSLGNR